MKTNYKSKHEKACLKRCVLRSVLKQLRSFTALIFDGNLFQSLGADAINDLSPKVLLVMVPGNLLLPRNLLGFPQQFTGTHL